MMQQMFVGILDPKNVFVLVADRSEFDRLARPVTDLGPRQDGGHVLTKTVNEGEMTVIFQHWISEPSASV
jgi:hypothetical protein